MYDAADPKFSLSTNWQTHTGLLPLNIVKIRFYWQHFKFTQEPFHPLFCHLKILGCAIFSEKKNSSPCNFLSGLQSVAQKMGIPASGFCRQTGPSSFSDGP